MTTRAFTTTELARLNVPPDSPDDVAYSDVLLADEAVTTLKYSAQRRCVFRADDGRTYAVTYETEVDSGDYEHGPAPENHGWYGDTVEAVLVEQQPVTELRWLPADVPRPAAAHLVTADTSAAPAAPADRAAVLREAAAWFDGRSVLRFFGLQAAAELHRMADELLGRSAGASPPAAEHPAPADVDGVQPAVEPAGVSWEARAWHAIGLYTQTAVMRDDLARRLHAVERLCSGRPGYHTITVKALLTAMGEAAAPAAGELGTCSACGEPAVRYALSGWSHSLCNGCGEGEPVVAEFVPAAGTVQAHDADDEQGAEPLVAYRSRTVQMLRCLAHVPPPAARAADCEPVTPEDLPDGGICTYPGCGADVLITEGN